MSYASSTAGVKVDLGAGTVQGGYAEGDRLLAIENLVGSPQDDTLTGDRGRNSLVGGTGHDTLAGGDGNDALSGGSGDDDLRGDYGDDTYVYDPGDGYDRLYDSFGADQVVFGAGILPADVRLARGASDADDLILTIGSTGQGIWIDECFFGPTGSSMIERFAFADGTEWSIADVKRLWLERQVTVGADTIAGTAMEETLTGGAGNDDLRGGDGNDTYVYKLGDGYDRLDDTNGDDDRVLFGPGISADEITIARAASDADDLILTIGSTGQGIWLDECFYGPSGSRMIERFAFADGTEWGIADVKRLWLERQVTVGADTIAGADMEETLAGGAGNDDLRGGDGNDTYVYNIKDGYDRLYDTNGDADRVLFGAGICADEITIARAASDPDDLILTIGSTGQGIWLDEYFYGSTGSYMVERFSFTDGTEWTSADVQIQWLERQRTDGNDTIDGFANADLMAGGLGADTLRGQSGDDFIDGGSGNDSLDGGNGADTLDGGNGADTLVGGSGADLYWFRDTWEVSLGGDRVVGFSYSQGDRIAIAAGETWTVAKSGTDALVTLGSGAVIVLVGVSADVVQATWFVAG